MKKIKILILPIFILSFFMIRNLFAQDSSAFAQTLPDFSLKAPDGQIFTREGLSKNGLVLVVTAPILKNKKAQEGWNRYLLNAKSSSQGRFVYLEDLQASAFKGMAIRGMKKKYQSGKEPVLLIDDTGKTRQALKVSQKRTVVLVYDRDGNLIYSETGKPSSKAASIIWQKLK